MGTTLFAYSPSPINNRMRLSPVCGHTYLKGFDVIIASWNCGCFLFFESLCGKLLTQLSLSMRPYRFFP